jgi:hypothetical protein
MDLYGRRKLPSNQRGHWIDDLNTAGIGKRIYSHRDMYIQVCIKHYHVSLLTVGWRVICENCSGGGDTTRVRSD